MGDREVDQDQGNYNYKSNKNVNDKTNWNNFFNNNRNRDLEV